MPGGELRLGELSITGYDQAWLPPLVARDSASSRLVKNLQELDTSVRLLTPTHVQSQVTTSLASSTPCSARGLRTISRFGARANERAAEAETDLGFHDSEDRVDGAFESGTSHPSSGVHGNRDGCAKAFDQLVESIQMALSGGDSVAPVRPLKRDEAVTETLPARGVRHYKIALPSRPTAVTVNVTRMAGMSPALWGSTGCERPTARNHDMRGSHDRLVYEHALSAADETEETAGLDRRKSVPPCRDLFVTVEADAGECSFKLQVAFGQVKVVLSRAEIASQIQKIRRGWEARVATLQSEPAKREQFEEHVKNITEDIRQKRRDNHRGVDFLDRNMRHVASATPQQSLMRLQKRALLGFEKQDVISARRVILQEESDKSKLQWLRRSEERRLLRLAEQERLEVEQRTEDVRRGWLVRLAAVSFAENFWRSFKKLKDYHDYMNRIIVSACILQRFMIRSLCKKRRLALYDNVVRFRMGLAAYARTIRPAAMCACQPVVKGFLHEYAFHRESPTLSGALKRFRATVVLIQQWWQQRCRTRQAYVELFLPYWEDAQAKVYREMATEIASQEMLHSHFGGGSQPRRGSNLPSGGAHRGGDPPPGRRTSRLPTANAAPRHTSVVVAEEDRAFFNRVQDIEQYMDQVPQAIARRELWKYVGDMQRNYPHRLKAWEEGKKERQWRQDLAAFGVSDAEATQAASQGMQTRPRSVYINREELESYVRTTVQMWRKNGYTEIRHHRRQILGHFYRIWARALQPLPNEGTTMNRLRQKMTFLANSTMDLEDAIAGRDEGQEAPEQEQDHSEPEAEACEEAA